MTQDRWSAVDAYIDESVLGSDTILDDVLESSRAAACLRLPSRRVRASSRHATRDDAFELARFFSELGHATTEQDIHDR